jgi:hypothetical protein
VLQNKDVWFWQPRGLLLEISLVFMFAAMLGLAVARALPWIVPVTRMAAEAEGAVHVLIAEWAASGLDARALPELVPQARQLETDAFALVLHPAKISVVLKGHDGHARAGQQLDWIATRQQGGSRVLWLCGEQPLPAADWQRLAKDASTLDPQARPPKCR